MLDIEGRATLNSSELRGGPPLPGGSSIRHACFGLSVGVKEQPYDPRKVLHSESGTLALTPSLIIRTLTRLAFKWHHRCCSRVHLVAVHVHYLSLSVCLSLSLSLYVVLF